MIFSVLIFRFQLLNIRGVFHAYVFFLSMMIQLTKTVFVVIWDAFLVKMFTLKRVCETSWLFLGSHQELETPF